MTYADTSIFVSVYAFEDAAEEAQQLLVGLFHPVPLNHFLWLEMRNAIRRKVPTRQATKSKIEGTLKELETSIAEGVIEFYEINFLAVFDRAEDLSVRFTEKLNTRAFDVLHVAIAIEPGGDRFLTFDRGPARRKGGGLSGHYWN